MKSFEAWGGPLDGRAVTLCLPPGKQVTATWYEPGFVPGQYRPPAPGTNATNADGLPVWHWWPSEG